ncbi:autotransporter assembly complex family protein [Alkanindiges sp. WGS2144]|uniref:autotransporter assembly complex protein TamA n=1 Tax=Alkanindiges sp. WGS2144 TaxID=3366808 RepID=UPI00375154E0
MSGLRFYRCMHQVGTGVLLLGSALYAQAQPQAVDSSVLARPDSGINQSELTGQATSPVSSLDVPSGAAVPDDMDVIEPIVLEPVDMAGLIQQAETAKQEAASDFERISTPSSSNTVPDEVVQTTNNELITSSIESNLEEVGQTPVPIREADSIDEQASAEKELERAREATQTLMDHADINQDKQPDDVIAQNAEALDTDATAVKKPNIFKRVWYHFWPPKGELAAAMPTIDVDVIGASDLQSDNIRARLEQYTVEAFTDFRASLPQLRSMAREASEAVGYYNSVFRFEQINADTLRVHVTPNEPVLVTSQDIRFEGEATEDNSFLRIQKEPDLKVGDQMNDQLYEQTKTRISTAATEKGYFDGYWIMHDVKVTLPDNTADINLAYDSGERYKLGSVEFKNTDPDKPLPLKEELLRQLVPFEENDEYGSWKVNGLSRNLSDTRYFNNVQVDLVIPDPIVKPVELPADADVDQLNTSQRQALAINNEAGQPADNTAETPESATAVVDESQFAGIGHSEDTPLQRSTQAQQDLTEAQIKEAERQEAAAKIRETKIIPVVVTVNADQPNSAEVGVGYGTDTEFRLRTQYRKALVNSRGHSLESNLELSKIRQAVDVRYNLPYKHPLQDTISIFGGYEQEDRKEAGRDLGLETSTATVGVERAIKPRGGKWQHTISARYRLDELKRNSNEVVDQSTLPPPFNLQNSRFEQQSLLFGYGISKTETVGRLDPVRGFRQFYQAEVGSKSLLTDTDLAILRAGWRFIYSFGTNDNHQVVGRADAATIVTEAFEEVPYNLRFFAGGDQSIRGYDYKSLSTEQNGYLIGGQNLAVASMEYNYQFKPKWRGAVFVDAGNAFDKQFNDPVKVGAGVGVRWSSPVGPIRIDVGAGVSETHVPIRLHFFIGPQL